MTYVGAPLIREYIRIITQTPETAERNQRQ